MYSRLVVSEQSIAYTDQLAQILYSLAQFRVMK